MFWTRFLVSNLFCVFLIGIIFLLKRLLRNKLSSKIQYYVWFILLLALVAPFLPSAALRPIHFALSSNSKIMSQLNTINGNVTYGSDGIAWINDVTETVNSNIISTASGILTTVWIIGVTIALFLYAWSSRKLRRIKQLAATPEQRILVIFESCRRKIALSRETRLLESNLVTSPLSFGIGTQNIVLPANKLDELSDEDLEFILLHELVHCCHRDILINYFCCWVQILYWFNPLIWIAFAQMRNDREAYCDWSVLNTYYDQETRLRYGYTLLQLAQCSRHHIISPANYLCNGKAQIKYRIEKITEFGRETVKTLTLGICLLIVLAMFVSLQIPVLAVFVENTDLYEMPKDIKISEQNYKSLFGSGTGCAIIYNLNADVYNVYNQSLITKRIAPCSTCKIYCAANALEQGLITPSDNQVAWDYIRRDFPSWNSDQTLDSAMRNSANWYFQYLDEAEGITEVSAFYNSIGYGNGYIGNDLENYWNGSTLKISPLEQVQLLLKLYRNDFGFKPENVLAVENAMLISENEGSRLYGKTGTGRLNGNDVNGWFIGYVETEGNTFFFAVNLQNEDHASGAEAVQITEEIFDSMGIQLKTV